MINNVIVVSNDGSVSHEIQGIYSIISTFKFILSTVLRFGPEKATTTTHTQTPVNNIPQRQIAITYNIQLCPLIATQCLPIATQSLTTADRTPAAVIQSPATAMRSLVAVTQSLTTACQFLPTATQSLHITHPAQSKASLQAPSFNSTASIINAPPPTPSPLTSSQIDTQGRLCLSYVFQVSARLSREHFTRFVDVLKAYRQPNSFEITRHELSTIFELANEYQLWEECLELVFPNWLAAMEGREQARLRRMQRQGQGLPV